MVLEPVTENRRSAFRHTPHDKTREASIQPRRPYLICMLGCDRIAIDVHSIRHIAAPSRVWPIPMLPDYIEGVTRVTDRLVPLIDLRKKFGMPSRDYDVDSRFVELDLTYPMAIAVDGADCLTYIENRDVVPPSELFAGAQARGIEGVAHLGASLCTLLDLQRILLGDPCAATEPLSGPTMMPDEHGTVSSPQDDTSGNQEQPTVAARPDELGSDQTPGSIVLSMFRGSRVSPMDREAHVLGLLERAVSVGDRRSAGFRRQDPRLPALAVALLDMPAAFRTSDLAPVVAALLDRTASEYGMGHLRYDLAKFRARNLAARIGTTMHYRLTSIGQAVCQAIEQGPRATEMINAQINRVLHAAPTALSA